MDLKTITNITNPVQLLNEQKSIALNTQIALGLSSPSVLPLKDGQFRYLKDTTFLVPVTLRLESESEAEGFKLPLDPLITINGSNVITRRYVAKNKDKGSIKELWSQNDYTINISGVLCKDYRNSLNEYVKKLRKYCEEKRSIHITCDTLNNVFDISQIAIENFSFPFTKGEDYQSFSIQALSDNSHQLLEEKK